jgi:hypothetical protein
VHTYRYFPPAARRQASGIRRLSSSECTLMLGIIVVLLAASFCAAESKRPACNAASRGLLWSESARSSPAHGQNLSSFGDLEICAQSTFKYKWRRLTVSLAHLRKGRAKTAGPTPAPSPTAPGTSPTASPVVDPVTPSAAPPEPVSPALPAPALAPPPALSSITRSASPSDPPTLPEL